MAMFVGAVAACQGIFLPRFFSFLAINNISIWKSRSYLYNYYNFYFTLNGV